MKTLAGWIIGVFALGLVLGGVFDGTSAVEDVDTKASLLENLPAVDCGVGREAVFAPTVAAGQTSLTVKCVPSETGYLEDEILRTNDMRMLAGAPSAPAPAPVYVVAPAPAPAPVAVRAPARNGDYVDPNARVENDRDWKDSALVIGASAGAGAGIGALAKGKKGAAVGAAIGGVAGTVYELARKKD